MRRKNIVAACVIACGLGGWWIGPQAAVWSMALVTAKGEEPSARVRDRIVFFGARSIQPTIRSIEDHSPWVRRYCYLPSALKMIGGSAKDELRVAIDAQTDPRKRAHLISALQSAFGDYSRFGVLLDDVDAGRVRDTRWR